MLCLSSLSSSTSNVFIFSGGTPWMSSTCTAALENPHCGAFGVPFMKSTTGVDSTAFWIFARTSWLMYRRAMERERDGEEPSATAGTRAGARRAVNCEDTISGCDEQLQSKNDARRNEGRS